MSGERLLFGEGARGDLVRAMQTELERHGLYRATVDGDYGGETVKAVRAFRRSEALPPAPHVDPSAWKLLTKRPVPAVRDRALQVTASFEGHGFTLAQGNFDGAGITWGVIGFTLKGGELARIVLDVHAQHPRLVEQAFGANTGELLRVMRASWPTQLAFANRLSLGRSKARLAEPWKTAFRHFGEFPQVQAVQLARVAGYLNPAKRDARALGLRSELGLALCFDIHVQDGGISPSAMRKIKAAQAAHAIKDERELRIVMAHAVADSANPVFRADVLSRKLALATGVGVVHGAMYVLRNWGLAELPVAARPPQPAAPPARRRAVTIRR
jgi:peptidoglycan hydrolase-like protein with peptidoglycan-binding domain